MVELAGRASISMAQVSRYERGVNVPDAISLRALARALECSLDDLA